MSGSPRWVRVIAAALGALAGTVLLSGCVRSQVAIAISPEDKVTGEVVVAVVVPTEQDQGAALLPPADLGPRVRSEPYRQDGYAGTRLLFAELTFEEFGRLIESTADAPENLTFQLRRAGSLVLFNGRIDLTGVPNPERVDVQVRISFPGPVTGTNGDLEDDTVSWFVQPGRVSEMSATARYAEPGTRSMTQWSLLVGGLAAVVVLIIGLLAYLSHRRFAEQPVARPRY